MSYNSRIPLIYGAGGIGAPGTFCKITDPSVAQSLIDSFSKCGPAGIDTSQIYGLGSSEEILASLNLHELRVDTKIYPSAPGDHAPARLKELFQQTLTRLKSIKIRVFYLHAPDRTVPYEDTVTAVNDLYNEGHFEYFGLSNYKAYEVAEIVGICKAKGYILPAVYEGVYSAVDRTAETELIPCLRRFNIKFAPYSPMAGGFLAGLHLDSGNTVELGSHFDPNQPFAYYFINRYMNMVEDVKELRTVVEHNMNLQQASIRWLQHHSAIIPSDLGIIFGGSKTSHIERVLMYNAEGPLPDAVVQAYEDCYQKVKRYLPNYHHDPAWYDPKLHGY